MRVFIDTNNFLGYFNENGDIKSLEILERLLKEEKFSLFLPVQVQSEYTRNVETRINQVCTSIKKAPPNLIYELPAGNEELKKIVKNKVEEINKEIELYKKKRLDKYLPQARKTDELIQRIFALGEHIEYSPEILERSKVRHIKGNPPKKENNDSHGDAINWESLLEHAIDRPLVVISKDSDYTEKTADGEKLNRFLIEEWKSKSKEAITHHFALGNFINSFEKKEVIPKSTITQETITTWPMTSVLGYRGEIVIEAFNQIQAANTITQSALSTLSTNSINFEPITSSLATAGNFFTINQDRIIDANNTISGIIVRNSGTILTPNNQELNKKTEDKNSKEKK